METLENTKVYFVSTDGQLKEYTIVNKKDWGNTAPQAGCDILIKDDRGLIYSGSTTSYLPSKKEALEKAEKRGLSFVNTYKNLLETYQEALNNIQDQLKNEN